MRPKGFWSYARGDDAHLDEMLGRLRARVEGEVSMLLGEDVGIFHDIHDIRGGDRWAETLREGVTSASFLIPVLTPRYFNRPWCREETLTFLRLAEEKGVEPLIFPILFVDVDDDPDCEVRRALAPFQYRDFRGWRFESDPTRRERLLNAFGEDVKLRLRGKARPRPAPAAGRAAAPSRAESAGAGGETTGAAAPASPRHRTHTVDPMPGRGDFHTLAAAIAAAAPGDRIVVREGVHREALRLSKPLEIVGEGERDRVVVTTATGSPLHCEAPMATVSGLTFRRERGEGKDVGVWITAGAAVFEDCAFESRSLAGVEIGGEGTAPVLRRCVVRDGDQVGVLIHGSARPLLEDCEVSGAGLSGVQVSDEGTAPTLRRCVARDGRQGGFLFTGGAAGVMERCEATGNAYSGIFVRSGADPLLRDCRFGDNRQSGAFIYEGGRGRFEDCRIDGNRFAGITVREGGAPVVRGGVVTGNRYQAVWIVDAESGGTFTGVDLRGNARGAWRIAEGAEANLVRPDNLE